MLPAEAGRAARREMATDAVTFGSTQEADEPYRLASDCHHGTSDAIRIFFDHIVVDHSIGWRRISRTVYFCCPVFCISTTKHAHACMIM